MIDWLWTKCNNENDKINITSNIAVFKVCWVSEFEEVFARWPCIPPILLLLFSVLDCGYSKFLWISPSHQEKRESKPEWWVLVVTVFFNVKPEKLDRQPILLNYCRTKKRVQVSICYMCRRTSICDHLRYIGNQRSKTPQFSQSKPYSW